MPATVVAKGGSQYAWSSAFEDHDCQRTQWCTSQLLEYTRCAHALKAGEFASEHFGSVFMLDRKMPMFSKRIDAPLATCSLTMRLYSECS